MTGADYLRENMGLVDMFATRAAERYGAWDQLDDLRQAAAEGFLKAFDHKPYDPAKGTVGTFVGRAVQHAIDDYRAATWENYSIPRDVADGTRTAKTGETLTDLGAARTSVSLDSLLADGVDVTAHEGGITAVDQAVTADQTVTSLLDGLGPAHARTLRQWLEYEGDWDQWAVAEGTSREAIRKRFERAAVAVRKISR